MENEKPNFKETMAARRHALGESLRTISVAELNTLGEKLSPHVDRPILEKFLGVISDPGSGIFHHARAVDRSQVIYCPNKDIGMWFIPDFGTGRLEPEELKIMKEIVQSGVGTRHIELQPVTVTD